MDSFPLSSKIPSNDFVSHAGIQEQRCQALDDPSGQRLLPYSLLALLGKAVEPSCSNPSTQREMYASTKLNTASLYPELARFVKTLPGDIYNFSKSLYLSLLTSQAPEIVSRFRV